MMPTTENPRSHAVRALDEGRGFVAYGRLHLGLVEGAVARAWLQDLVTAGVEGLGAGEARRSLLLSPTGRVRADFHIARLADGFLLLQDARQPGPVAELLAPYILSSDVSIDRAPALAVVSVPNLLEAPSIPAERETVVLRPSLLGPGLSFVVASGGLAELTGGLLGAGLVAADEDAVEVRRIRLGEPRFPVDVSESSLPAEAGWETTMVDFTKGCFLGQESVAKVRNFGHPTRAVLALHAEDAVSVGDAVLAFDARAGEVTSAAPDEGESGTALLARVRWADREGPLVTTAGSPLRPK